jgi:hypothetical protein
VLARNYFSEGDIFRDFCEIFGIKPISISADFEQRFTPDPETNDYKSKSDALKKGIKLSLLIIAASTYPENWHKRYTDFCSILDTLEFIECGKISIDYKNILVKDNIPYHRDRNRIYFVNSLNSPLVFQKFVDEMYTTFKLDGDKNQTDQIFFLSEPAKLVDELVDKEIKRSVNFRKACQDLGLMVVQDEYEEVESEEPSVHPGFGQSNTNVLENDVENPVNNKDNESNKDEHATDNGTEHPHVSDNETQEPIASSTPSASDAMLSSNGQEGKERNECTSTDSGHKDFQGANNSHQKEMKTPNPKECPKSRHTLETIISR